jgi:exopolyphosphatase/guanosine-5'-triphosphate,3'-diphosphate pyrophosphatase
MPSRPLQQEVYEEPGRRDITPAPETIAAVDLGSNSFHMIIARLMVGQPQVLDRMREMVQLAAGLDRHHHLSQEAQGRALACLERFGQRLRSLPPGSVRAVGTSTLRQARNAAGFIAAAQRALGHPIEVISGQEEARLIYLGVAHTLPAQEGRRLVIDIGGGSTECIIGERFEAQHRESLRVGCVIVSRHFFPKGALTSRHMRDAETAARLQLLGLEGRYRAIGWQDCAGSSGTIKAVQAILLANGWSEDGITLDGLCRLRDAVLEAGNVSRLELPGLRPERAPVLPGGLAILLAAFESLGIERMQVSEGAMREGVLYDLLGRIQHEDVRDRTIVQLTERYHVDAAQAARVEKTALECLAQVAQAWGLMNEEHRQILGWAARLHEIGLAIAHSGYHKHGAYLAQYSDMLGFSSQEQQVLAALIRMHRRTFVRSAFQSLPGVWKEPAWRLSVLLRLAVLLHHSRSPEPLPEFKLSVSDRTIELKFARGFLAHHPLTLADLKEEADYLRSAKLRLKVS